MHDWTTTILLSNSESSHQIVVLLLNLSTFLHHPHNSNKADNLNHNYCKMLLHPLFSVYDLDDRYEPSWRSDQLRRQQQQQAYYNELARRERLRQVELERERQYRRQVEEERRQRQQEAMLQHLHRQRRAEEYRQRLAEQRTRNSQAAPYEEPTQTETRGRNVSSGSQTYRIPVRIIRDQDPYSDDEAEKLVNVSHVKDEVMEDVSREQSIPILRSQSGSPNSSEADIKTKLPRKQRVSVVVEDASDSENEDADLKSIWRNRRPSPGQWIEPIEFY